MPGLGSDPASVRQRVEALEKIMERLFVIPGTNRAVGLDVILDLVPFAGSTAGASYNSATIRAGGYVGYNIQLAPAWLVGIEGDIAYSAMKDDVAGVEVKVPWFGTARGRIGYAGWGSLLPYITGGAAIAKLEVDGAGGGSDTKVGWTIGAGLEYALFSSWSVKVEYLYADLGKFDISGTDVDFNTHIVRAGLNYRF